ncbi:MAG: NAD(P)-dependent glycerol-3-phosphate dehydrogenase [Planctomycetes bacterium]|nr:NAD(P)-dependent glycerol-3-phosphate dehydrogenase [Planctomycetota bacterium]
MPALRGCLWTNSFYNGLRLDLPPNATRGPEPVSEGKSRTAERIAVIGCGGWGTALALLLHENGHQVTLWGVEPDYVDQMRESRRNPRYLPDIEIPGGLQLTSSMSDCVPTSAIVVAATPTIYLREVCRRLSAHLRAGQMVLNVSKGIEEETLLLGSQVIRDVCKGAYRLAGLYGPSHAEEVARKLPTTVVATAESEEDARRVQRTFMAPMFRVYTNTDMLGVELGAALKNVIAIAAGICDGMGFGDNARSALLTRGLAEISRLGAAMGARPHTFAGLTGLGDLITTCVSPYGRNRSVGIRLARGEGLDAIVEQMDQVAEGVRTTRSVLALAHEYDVEMPISRAVHAVLFEGMAPRRAAVELMQRDPKPEHQGDVPD